MDYLLFEVSAQRGDAHLSLALDDGGVHRRGYGSDLRTQRAILTEQLGLAGTLHAERGERTIIVVDGLDHIPREQNPTRSLLEELPAPAAIPAGVFIILGTQTLSVLPRQVREKLESAGRRVDVPPLQPSEVHRLAEKAGVAAWLLPGQLDDLARASEGHPLAVTYLLQELASLERSEPDVNARGHAVDRLLADASAYGGDIETRYRGYLEAVDGDAQMMDLLGSVARLRGALDLRWLETWNPPDLVTSFADRTATFFRRDGTTWRFVHNSFRRYLVDATSQVAGVESQQRDRQFHVTLAEACASSDEDWQVYRDEEIAHRYLARQYDEVLAAAAPMRLREQLGRLRPASVIRDHALVALRAAGEVEDYSAYTRMLLFLNELWLRSYVLDADRLATAIADVEPEWAFEHAIAGGESRVKDGTATDLAARLAANGYSDKAEQILRVIGGLRGIVERSDVAHDRDLADAVADWAESTFHLSGLDEVMGQLDRHLPLSPEPGVEASQAGAASTEDPAAERRLREREEQRATVIACRSAAHARCTDVAAHIRDESALNRLTAAIDDEASIDWRARARVVRALAAFDDDDSAAVYRWVRSIVELDELLDPDPEDAVDHEDPDDAADAPRHAVSLTLRTEAAELLVRSGLAEAAEIDVLVGKSPSTPWPSYVSGSSGLEPYSTYIKVARLRLLRGVEVGDPPAARANRDAGRRRFRQALNLIARLEAQQIAATMAGGDPPLVAAAADPIVRLLEVPGRVSRDWTEWYAVRGAAHGLYFRLMRVAAAARGTGEVGRVFAKFVAAWNEPERSEYWSTTAKHAVISACLDFGDESARSIARDWLRDLELSINTHAREPHSRVEDWVSQANTCARAGDEDGARHALSQAVTASFGVGIHDDDSQLEAWLEWLASSGEEGAQSEPEIRAALLRYASRLVGAAGEGHADAAAEALLAMLWRYSAADTSTLADALCDRSVLSEEEALRGVLTGAGADRTVSARLVATATAELLIPIMKYPSDSVGAALRQRAEDPEVSGALTMIKAAEAVWSLSSDDDFAPSHDGPPSDSTPEDPPVEASGAPQLLAILRKSETPEGLTHVVRQMADRPITLLQAKELLKEASRLMMSGEALGTIAALAARAGAVEQATSVVADALARMPPYGWVRRYDGGTRLELFGAALRYRCPELVLLATRDLTTALTTGALTGHVAPRDLRRIIETLAVNRPGSDGGSGYWFPTPAGSGCSAA